MWAWINRSPRTTTSSSAGRFGTRLRSRRSPSRKFRSRAFRRRSVLATAAAQHPAAELFLIAAAIHLFAMPVSSYRSEFFLSQDRDGGMHRMIQRIADRALSQAGILVTGPPDLLTARPRRLLCLCADPQPICHGRPVAVLAVDADDVRLALVRAAAALR